MVNNEYRSEDIEAPTGRNLIAQGAALCNEYNANFVVPRLGVE